MLNGSFLLMRNQCIVSIRTSFFLLSTTNANAPACKVTENGTRFCLLKNRIVIIEFSVT